MKGYGGAGPLSLIRETPQRSPSQWSRTDGAECLGRLAIGRCRMRPLRCVRCFPTPPLRLCAVSVIRRRCQPFGAYREVTSTVRRRKRA